MCASETPLRLTSERGVPDLYVDGAPARAMLDAAFCRAFACPAPGLFDGEADGGVWIDAMARQPVGVCYVLDRAAFAMKIDLHLPAAMDVLPPLKAFATLLGCALALDLGVDTADDSALLITPDGRLVRGALVATGLGREEDVPEVAFRADQARD
ncbi:hypothetical protein [Azorhizobium oxalatiphilum]|nr:hypothetical protein [Azorhizobium oxalatiphilum]